MSRSGGTMLTFSGEILLLLNCQSRSFWRRIASYSQSCSSPVRAECDLKEFFQHENQAFPAVLSESRRLYSCQNSQLMSILETRVVPTDQESKADDLSRGQGGRREVTKKNTVPSNWRNFLRHSDNKMEFNSLQRWLPKCWHQVKLVSQMDLMSSVFMKLVLVDWTIAITRKLIAAYLYMPGLLRSMGARQSW